MVELYDLYLKFIIYLPFAGSSVMHMFSVLHSVHSTLAEEDN